MGAAGSYRRFTLLDSLGKGGMAEVFLAREEPSGHLYALKALLRHFANDPTTRERFRREAEAARHLHHANIVRVYGTIRTDNREYLLMEYVRGWTLAQIIRDRAPLRYTEAIRIAIQIASALQCAHEHSIIHRDIKPSNVLITAEGVVKVVDFGIAKIATDSSLTGTGLTVGTAAYFSPEQAKGQSVVPQSDLYSLGVTLYEMLTGRLPFTSDNPMGLAYKHISEAPPPPIQFNPTIPLTLNQLILRALEKDPAKRFSSAASMETKLRAILGGAPARGFPPPPAPVPPPRPANNPPFVPWPDAPARPRYQPYKIESRPRPMVAPPVAPIPDYGPRPRPVRVAPISPPPRVRPTSGASGASWLGCLVVLVLVLAGANYLAPTLLPNIVGWLQHAIAAPNLPADRTPESVMPSPVPLAPADVRLIEANLARLSLDRPLEGDMKSVGSVAFSPDGNLLASGSNDHVARIWKVSDGSVAQLLRGHTDIVDSVAFTPDGTILASASHDKTIRLWRVSDGKPLQTLTGHTAKVTSLAFGSDGQQTILASGSEQNAVRLWQVADGRQIASQESADHWIINLAFSPDGRTLAWGAADGTIKLWRVDQRSNLQSLAALGAPVTAVAFSPDGSLLAAGASDGTIVIRHLPDGARVRSLAGPVAAITGLAFTPDGKLLTAASSDGTVRFWRIADGKGLRLLESHSGVPTWSVAIAPDGATLATGSNDGLILLWQVPTAPTP